MDTIFALASARGKAGVSVVRISGPQSWRVAADMAGHLPKPRMTGVRDITIDGGVVDRALVICFEENRSFTGEMVVEIHLHGSPAIVACVLRHLGDCEGLRLAEAGEFSRRALENGRLDLAQVEGLGDLIEAETEAQRRQAMRVFSGVLGARVASWRQDLVEVSALLAAGIDFVDEDIPRCQTSAMLERIDRVLGDCRAQVAGADVAERVRDGFEVAIVGAPNVGKSTLLNAIAGRPAALTSSRAGTTRDIIEVRMDLGGLAVTLLDTAGVRDGAEDVEQLGITLARERARTADLRVILTDDGQVPAGIGVEPDDIVVFAKADLNPREGLCVSGLTGAGVGDLLGRVRRVLSCRAAGAALITRERHRKAAVVAGLEMCAARELIANGLEFPELAGERVRAAILALDVIIGKVDVEDILGEIFARFCIGK